MAGVFCTVFGILNLCEKNENIKSIPSCVEKLINTNNPNKDYEIPYKDLNVKKSIGDKFATTDIVIFVV